MSFNPVEEIWSAVCDELKKTISEIAFNCFLKDLVPVSFSDGEFIISINDEHKLGIIENNYLEKLNSCVSTVMGIEMTVKIVFDDNEEEIMKAEQFSEGLSFEDFFTFQN